MDNEGLLLDVRTPAESLLLVTVQFHGLSAHDDVNAILPTPQYRERLLRALGRLALESYVCALRQAAAPWLWQRWQGTRKRS